MWIAIAALAGFVAGLLTRGLARRRWRQHIEESEREWAGMPEENLRVLRGINARLRAEKRGLL